jgi:hypothetical protein
MRRDSSLHVATNTAFRRSLQPSSTARSPSGAIVTRLYPGALAFVAGFPGLIGLAGLGAALSRIDRVGLDKDGAYGLGIGMTAIAVILLVLGLRSFARIDGDRLTVRFFGIRATTVDLRELVSATFGMPLPSISFTIKLTDRSRRKVLLHANWWQDEAAIVRPALQALLDHDVPMDRSTARIVSQVLNVKRPHAQIVHRGLIWKKRTW